MSHEIFATCCAMLEALYDSNTATTSEQRAEADAWLRDVSESPEIWDVAHQILSCENLPVYTYFFAAGRILHKLRKGYTELTNFQGRISFRDCLIQHVITLTRLDEASNEKATPQGGRFRDVVRELSSSLAVMTIQMIATGEWKNAVVDLSNLLAENNCEIALVAVLTAIPEEVKSSRLELSRKARHDVIDFLQIPDNAAMVLNLLHELLSSTEDEYLRGIVLKCFAIWSERGCIDTGIAVRHPLFAACAEVAKNPGLLKHATEAIRGVIDYFRHPLTEKRMNQIIDEEKRSYNFSQEEIDIMQEKLIEEHSLTAEKIITVTLSLVHQFHDLCSAIVESSPQNAERIVGGLMNRLAVTISRLGSKFSDLVISCDPLGADIISAANYCLRMGGRKVIHLITPMWYDLGGESFKRKLIVDEAYKNASLSEEDLDYYNSLYADRELEKNKIVPFVQRAISAAAHAIRLPSGVLESTIEAEEEQESVLKSLSGLCKDFQELIGKSRFEAIIWVMFAQAWNYLCQSIRAEEVGLEQSEIMELPIRVTLLELVSARLDPSWGNEIELSHEAKLAVDVILDPVAAKQKTQMTIEQAEAILSQVSAYDPEFEPVPDAQWSPLSAVILIASEVFYRSRYCSKIDQIIHLALEAATINAPGGHNLSRFVPSITESFGTTQNSQLAKLAASNLRCDVDKLIAGCAVRIGNRLFETDVEHSEVITYLKGIHVDLTEDQVNEEIERIQQSHSEMLSLLYKSLYHLLLSISFPVNHTTAAEAGKSLRSLTKECAKYLAKYHIEVLISLQVFAQKSAAPYVSSSGNEAWSFKNVAMNCLWSLVKAIVALPHEEASDRLNSLIKSLISPLEEYVKVGERGLDSQLASMLPSVHHSLTSVVDFIHAVADNDDDSDEKDGDDNRERAIGSLDTVSDVITSLTPLLRALAQFSLGDEKIIEDICRCWTHSIRRLGEKAKDIGSTIIEVCVEMYTSENGQYAGFIYVISTLVKALSSSLTPDITSSLIQVLQHLTEFSSSTLLSVEGVNNYPSLAADYIYLHQRYLNRLTDSYVELSCAEEHVAGIPQLLQTSQEAPLRSICSFYSSILDLIKLAHESDELRRKLSRNSSEREIENASYNYLEPKVLGKLVDWVNNTFFDVISYSLISIVTSERPPSHHTRVHKLMKSLIRYNHDLAYAAVAESLNHETFYNLSLEVKEAISMSEVPTKALAQHITGEEEDDDED